MVFNYPRPRRVGKGRFPIRLYNELRSSRISFNPVNFCRQEWLAEFDESCYDYIKPEFDTREADGRLNFSINFDRVYTVPDRKPHGLWALLLEVRWPGDLVILRGQGRPDRPRPLFFSSVRFRSSRIDLLLFYASSQISSAINWARADYDWTVPGIRQ